MQGIVISEKILQICTVCKKYLSHGPIKISYSEGVKCGRCSAKSDIGAISCINSVFESVIFPCVNRYEGCLQLLTFQDVAKHEEKCIGKQYHCPLCPEAKYGSNSLLYLLSHYRKFHKSEIISEPCIIVDLEERKEHVYLYCNDIESIIIFINIKFNENRLFITFNTTIEDSNKVKYNISILEDGCQKYSSGGVYGLNLNSHEVDLGTLSLKNSTTSLHCIFDFDICNALKVISLPNTNYTAICIESYGYLHSNNHPTDSKEPKAFTKCRYLHRKLNSSSVGYKECYNYNQLSCNLCENYCATSGHTDVYTCSGKSICGICFHSGISDCHVDNNLDQGADKYYNCRYECNQYFKVSELIIHEKQCLLNTEEHLDDKALGMLHFGNYFCIKDDATKSFIVRNNLVTYNLNAFGSKGRIYMITERFKCIIFYEIASEIGQSYIKFRPAHQYSPDQYCIKFKVVKRSILPTKEVSTFSIDFVKNPNFFFCVFLRKLEMEVV